MINTTKPVRVFFNKTGRAKYIAHLDMAKCLQRAIKRAEIPVWYTMGYNPHMYLNYPLALSLGYESTSEFFDVKMEPEDNNYEEIQEKLNSVMPEGIEITKVSPPKEEPKEIVWATYDMDIYFEKPDRIKEKFTEFINKDKIIVEKKSKKGMKEIDLKPVFEVISIDGGEDFINFSLKINAGIIFNVNPMLIINKFCEVYNEEISHFKIRRTGIFNENNERFS